MAQQTEKQFFAALGRRIAATRKDKGFTQEKLAAEAGLDRVAIAYIETGKREPKVKSVYKIAKALDVSLSELFERL